MSTIKEKVEKIEQIVKKDLKSDFKYKFEFNYNEEFVVNECIQRVINKEYDIDGESLKLVLMLLKYPKDAVIPFDEYDCLFAIQYGDICVTDSFLKTKNFEAASSKYDELIEMINSSDINQIIDFLLGSL